MGKKSKKKNLATRAMKRQDKKYAHKKTKKKTKRLINAGTRMVEKEGEKDEIMKVEEVVTKVN